MSTFITKMQNSKYKKKSQLKIISWNMNSWRVRDKHLTRIINDEDPDIILLQETRLKCNNIHSYGQIEVPRQYHIYCQSDKEFPGYSGVAIMSKMPLTIKWSYTSRVLYAYSIDYDLYIGTLYMYNGFSERANVTKKISLYDQIADQCKDQSNVLIGGDWNLCLNSDTYKMSNPYSQDEMNKYKIFCDFFHLFYASGPTWWDYRGNKFKRNIGLGLDKFFVSKKRNFKIMESKNLRFYRSLAHPSDHCPILLLISIE